ncbi:MAG: excinuclease ABC subunit UvrC [Patescibacteria group bacterium]|nr:excinuclease ABC subunit UvrC [Patescibacteria group bacterium]
MNTLKSKLKFLPASAGVYLFKNSAGDILYVGKAKVLKNRVRSYFTQNHDLYPRTRQLVTNIADFEYIICDTETEALMLENNLIKRYQPHYNVMLKDDKNYQFIKIDYSTEIPQVYTTRKLDSKKAKFFGPYTSGASVRQTLQLLRYIIPYCGNSKIGSRPCFYYHLGRCPGVCAGLISLGDYKSTLAAIEKFLSGDLKRVAADLKTAMRTASKKRLFEKAARLRDQCRALEKMLERQKIVSPKRESHDLANIFAAGQLAAATLLQIREGRLIGRENFMLQNAKGEGPEGILSAFLGRYYLEASDVPPEINLPFPLKLSDLAEALAQKFGRRIKFLAPTRGRKRQLLKMAETNARDYLQTSSQNLAKEQAILTRALFELKDRLHLPQLPFRIECFDISNIQGTSPTGSMVVFENGKAKKSEYKRFAIKTLETPNDFGMMEEMLSRRFAHADENLTRQPPHSIREGKGGISWRLPDLIVVDGGRGQLNVALKVLKNSNLRIPALGLAKKLEEIYLPQLKSPLRLPPDSSALHLLQRVRDEAHRFAVTYHRRRRSRAMLAPAGKSN